MRERWSPFVRVMGSGGYSQAQQRRQRPQALIGGILPDAARVNVNIVGSSAGFIAKITNGITL